jgi:hypothetical protein
MGIDAFENARPNSAFAALNPEAESLADGIGSSYGIIGYKGKVWTLRLRGETYTFKRADDGSAAPFLDVIVLRSAPYKSKSFYPKDSFNDESSKGGRPTCSALNGITPDVDAQQRQADACALCPRNEWKMNGDRKGRDCADYKRLAVLIVPSQSKQLLGAPLMEPVFLRVPAASLNDLAILGEAMGKKGFHYSTYITRIGFQLDKPHPQMTFRALQALTEKEAPIVMPMREEAQALRITGESEVGKPQAALMSTTKHTQLTSAVSSQPSSSVKVATPSSASKPSAPTISPTSATLTASSISSGEDDEEAALMEQLAAAKAKKAAKAAAEAKAEIEKAWSANARLAEETGLISTGFGDVGLGDSQPIIDVAPSTVPSEEDTGPAEEADLDLDARVAGIFK